MDCGAPTAAKNSIYSNQTLKFQDNVTYRCIAGYTFSGNVNSEKEETIMCGPEGRLVKEPNTCSPVTCGLPPSLPYAALVDKRVQGTMTFASRPLVYKCKPGYSKVKDDIPWNPRDLLFSIECQPNGNFSKPV